MKSNNSSGSEPASRHVSAAARLGIFALSLLAIHLLISNLAGAAAIEWELGDGWRSHGLKLPETGKTFLHRLPDGSTGIAFTNYVSEQRALENSLLTSGAGVAAGDVDGDGWCDLYFCGADSHNALYRNLGNWRFEDVTAAAGVACEGQACTGAVFADVDADGDLDLLVNSLGGGTRLFLNDGKGHFTESTNSGLARRFGSTSLALADIDGNGTLDLYVANYATSKIEDHPNAKFDAKTIDGKLVITAIDGVSTASPELTNRYFVDAEKVVRELGEPDILYLNDGHGKFQPVSWTDGSFSDEQGQRLTLPPYDFGLSVMFRDMNGDGAPDLYICNDLFPPDRIWLNDGHGRFRAMSNLAVRNTSRFSMGVDFADLNRDGYDEFFVVDMLSREHPRQMVQTVGVQPLFLPIGKIDNRPQYKRNTLFLNRGDGTYAEIAQFSGLDATEWSWMPVFLDVDLDGFEDVLVTTGHTRDSLNADAVQQIMNARRQRRLSDAEQRALKKQFYPVLNLRNQAFRNQGDLTFQDKAHEWGFDYVGVSQGMCLADLDNDGDLDVIVNHLNGPAGLYRNETTAPRVAVRLKGKSPNTQGIGAKIRFNGGPVPQSQEMICGGRYLSGDDAVRVFATGKATNAMTIEVTWRNGRRSVVKDVRPNRLYEIDEEKSVVSGQLSAAPTEVPDAPASNTQHALVASKSDESGTRTTLFKDVSPLLHHAHVDGFFNDFERQPLLTRKLSQLGPGVTWCDLDGDGWDDLVIGSGAGGTMAVYHNDGHGGFVRLDKPPFNQPLDRDQTTILSWPKPNGQTVLLAGSSNYEDGQPAGSCVREFNPGKPAIQENLPAWEIAAGALALADVDGDGILDLFVGGRVVPGRYPETASSLMFRGNGSGFILDTNNCRRLGEAGLVSGAVFSDLDGDGFPELILACEWGPVKIFRNDHGRLSPWNPGVTGPSLNPQLSTLNQLTGWWNGVATGDFDGDGRLDIVASNWSRNTKYERHRQRPLSLYYGEWTGNGTIDALPAYFDNVRNKVVPASSFAVARSMPWIIERFSTHEAYGAAGVAEILAERARTARVLEAAWLETTLFLNRGDHFEVRVLPMEAQLSPAFGICVGDLDGDGKEDLFLSQNFFAVDGDTPRYDAGRGLCLAGDGSGGFQPMPGQESGVKIYGEQRGCALADFDHDGRTDLVVTQNGAETKLYQNLGAKPGLSIRLAGPPGNPTGVGASLRIESGGRLGPAREVHAGSGYWSQDSAVQIMSAPQPPTKLWVRWPGGKEMSVPIPAGAKKMVLDTSGKLQTSEPTAK